jgi:nucleotide-binding universal stress UspA family protein
MEIIKCREVQMFEKILYPTDFSDVAIKALEYVKKLKSSGTREVIVLHVSDDRGSESVARILGEDQFNKLKRSKLEETERKLKGVEKELVDTGLKVKLRIETGMPVREILRIEDEEKVSVTVIGSHGRSNLEEIFLGSVSEKVIRKSKNPVFVIKR